MANLHFSIGQDLGVRLHEISLDKLYSFDLQGALNIWKQSFGCDDEVAKELTLCKYICDVSNSDTGEVSVCPIEKVKKDRLKDYTIFDFDILRRKIYSYFQTYTDCQQNVAFEDYRVLISEVHRYVMSNLKETFSYKLDGIENLICGIPIESGSAEIKLVNLLKAAIKNPEKIELDIENIVDRKSQTILRTLFFIKQASALANDYNSIMSTLSFLEEYFDEKLKFFKECYYKSLKYEVEEWSKDVLYAFNRIKLYCENENVCYQDLEECDNSVEKFVENTIRINKELSDFHPVNILDKYDAGWLAPNGDFFGLNGEISNMMHCNLADAIVKYYNYELEENDLNYDYLIAKKGFVKISKDWILYEGYDVIEGSLQYNKKIPLTDIQKKKLIEYGNVCYGQKLFFGYAKTFCSTPRFEMLDDYHIEELLKLS